MESYGFADGDGNSITRGWQGTLEAAKAFAQRWINARPTAGCVEFWLEGDSGDDGETASSLETAYPE